MKTARIHIAIGGAVQGVGFRPFVYRTATNLGLTGFVLNNSLGVFIEAEGEESLLKIFLKNIEEEKPPLSVITSLEHSFLDPAGYDKFEIKESEIEDLSSKKKNLKVEKDKKQIKLDELRIELKKLEDIKRSSYEETLENLLSRIKLKTSQKKKIEEKIDYIEIELKRLPDEIKKIKKDIETNEKIKREIKKYPSILIKLGEKISDIEKVRIEYQDSLNNLKATIDLNDLNIPITKKSGKYLNKFSSSLRQIKNKKDYTFFLS